MRDYTANMNLKKKLWNACPRYFANPPCQKCNCECPIDQAVAALDKDYEEQLQAEMSKPAASN